MKAVGKEFPASRAFSFVVLHANTHCYHYCRHWEEFPAGGPPQYQRAPTEYERPPPYYYPGT